MVQVSAAALCHVRACVCMNVTRIVRMSVYVNGRIRTIKLSTFHLNVSTRLPNLQQLLRASQMIPRRLVFVCTGTSVSCLKCKQTRQLVLFSTNTVENKELWDKRGGPRICVHRAS